MTRVFLSYRRSDSRTITGRIYDRLVAAFGQEAIFRDVDDIPAGSDFRDVLEREVASCDVLLVIIGPTWTAATDTNGNQRLSDPNDFVRIEVETALRLPNVRVIPVLVQGAQMPTEADLPSTLRKLPYVNAIVVRDDPDFHNDMGRLVAAIGKAKAPRRGMNNRQWLPITLAGAAGIIILVVVVLAVVNSGININGNNNIVNSNVTINQGDPPEKKAQYIASTVYQYAANIDTRLVVVESTVGEDIFGQQLTDIRATNIPSALDSVSQAYQTLITQTQIDSLQQTFNTTPIPVIADKAITDLASSSAINPLTLNFMYQRLGEFQAASDELLQVLDTTKGEVTPDPAKAEYQQQRINLAVANIRNRAMLAYLTVLNVLSDVQQTYPSITVPLEAWTVLEPKSMIPRPEISNRILQTTRDSLPLYEQRLALIEVGQALLASDVERYAQDVEADLKINTDDDYNAVIGKAVSLRQFGRIDEAIAAFERYKEMFKPTDETAEQYADTAEQFTLQISQLGAGDGGVYIFALVPGSVAENAELKVGDIILDLNGVAVHNSAEMQEQLSKLKLGDALTIHYLRLNSDQTFSKLSVDVTAAEQLGVGYLTI